MKTLRFMVLFAVLSLCGNVMAQDASISQMSSDARNVSRTPEGDRTYYGLWAKDRLLTSARYKPRYASPEDSIRKRQEFVELCGIAFEAYENKDALKTVIYGDSALLTGFDNVQIYLYMAVSYETLGDYKRAEHFYREAKAHGLTNGKEVLSSFRQRMKERKKQEKLQKDDKQ